MGGAPCSHSTRTHHYGEWGAGSQGILGDLSCICPGGTIFNACAQQGGRQANITADRQCAGIAVHSGSFTLSGVSVRFNAGLGVSHLAQALIFVVLTLLLCTLSAPSGLHSPTDLCLGRLGEQNLRERSRPPTAPSPTRAHASRTRPSETGGVDLAGTGFALTGNVFGPTWRKPNRVTPDPWGGSIVANNVGWGPGG